ncbi:Allergen V5/Tpx-1-related protein [Akanthomyces lecanii RCEF 1005]|uniref:Allergen V5/Tpx-1-related protein n=1 Tax=Akanthomyces lecanii RCEF 1005 TaxID=1081108 RepID=A0A162KRB9_CORDF|nr:Allergen V5/Tpx-1-related protein [Akanthomyces lecanii RCEF 1005]
MILTPLSSLFLLPLLLQPTAAAAATITVTAAPSIPSKEPSYSKRYVFTSAVLNSTNTYRAQHNASSLTWNATLASFAASYLEAAQKDDCKFEHSGGPYGENIAIGYANATAAMEAWGDERKEYSFGKPGFDHGTGHFTQLVWKDTTTVGCERVLCEGVKGWFVACEYWPRGNVQGEFGDEVQKQVESGSGAERLRAELGLVATATAMAAWLSWM